MNNSKSSVKFKNVTYDRALSCPGGKLPEDGESLSIWPRVVNLSWKLTAICSVQTSGTMRNRSYCFVSFTLTYFCILQAYKEPSVTEFLSEKKRKNVKKCNGCQPCLVSFLGIFNKSMAKYVFLNLESYRVMHDFYI